MNILFLSLDRDLLGEDAGAGVVKRHLFYTDKVEQQTVLVYSPQKYGLKAKNWADNFMIIPTGGSNPAMAFYRMKTIGAKILSENNYDLIVCQDPFLTGLVGYSLKKKFKLPMLVDLHGDFFHNPEFLKLHRINKYLLPLGRRLIKKADMIRPVSLGIKEKLLKMGVKENKIEVVPTPVDLDHFRNADQKLLQDLKRRYAGKLIILFVGILKPGKQIGFFMRVLKRILADYPNLKFLIAGDGPKREQWENLAQELGIADQVEFLGKISHKELPAYYAAADIFVLPSASESLGKVIMEAAMNKVAVLSSDTLGAKSLISDGQTGLLFEINNKLDCEIKLRRLIDHPDLRKKLGEAGYEDIKMKYDYNKSLMKVLECWKRAAKT